MILLFAVTMIVAVTLSSCSDDIPGNEDEPCIVEPGKMLRFGINRNVQTRATHGVNDDWYESEFEEGDVIGCVIYKKSDNSFVAVAEFSYPGLGTEAGYLLLNYVWEKKDGQIMRYDQSASTIIRRLNGDTKKGYLELQKGDEYGFVFFYPFFTQEILLEEWNKLSNPNETKPCHVPYSMFFMPGSPNYDSWHVGKNYDKFIDAGLVSDNREKAKVKETDKTVEKPTAYSWTEYPAFVGVFQNDPDGKQSQFSNHMWVKCDIDSISNKNISKNNKETLRSYDLTFKKKMATVDIVISDESIEDDIFIRHPKGTGDYTKDRVDASTGIIRGKKWNLLDGAFDDYNHLTWNTGQGGSIENFETNYELLCYKDKTREDFHPFKLPSTTERRWRLILPPQDNLEWQLYFNVKEEDKDGKEVSVQKHIDIHEQLTELKENHLYIIKVMSKQTWGIRIRDWEEKNKGILIED